jgi:hypothetical protein
LPIKSTESTFSHDSAGQISQTLFPGVSSQIEL